VSSNFLPYSRQTIEDDDIAAVAAALSDDFLTTGPGVESFERAFANATGASHAVACNSGTAALHLPLLALGVGPGDAVIVPSVTFVATANVVRMTGAEVVFADVDPDTGLLTPETFAQAIERAPVERRLAGVMPVHLNGQICDLAGIAEIARSHDMWIVEDACHALGAADVGECRYSAAAAFSTHAVKGITTGEGGVVVTADAESAARMARLRSHGLVRSDDAYRHPERARDGDAPARWYYEMPEIGWNYRLPDILCALGISQLRKLPRLHAARAELAARYREALAPLAPLVRPVPRDPAQDGWHLFPILIDFADTHHTRATLMETLRQSGIGTQVHYIPVHTQPYYEARYGTQALPGADAYYAHCLSLPFFPGMTGGDVVRVVEALGAALSGSNREELR